MVTGKLILKLSLLMVCSGLASFLVIHHVRHALTIGMTCFLAYFLSVLLLPDTLGLSTERRVLMARLTKRNRA